MTTQKELKNFCFRFDKEFGIEFQKCLKEKGYSLTGFIRMNAKKLINDMYIEDHNLYGRENK